MPVVPTPVVKPNPLAAPKIDIVSLTPQGGTASQYTVSVSCELMNNSVAAMPVSSTKKLKVVQDAGGHSLLFSIGSDKRLVLLKSTSGIQDSGYQVLDLLSQFEGYSSAISFDVSQDIKGLISFAFALERSDGRNMDIFFADRLSNDLSITDFTKLASISTKIEGIDIKFVLEGMGIILGTSDDGNRALLTLQGKLGRQAYFYQLHASTTTVQRLQLLGDVNVNKQSIHGFDVGFISGQRANYFLYDVDGRRSLVANTLASSSSSSETHDFSSGKLRKELQNLAYNCIATATDRSQAQAAVSDLFIGADSGVYWIPAGNIALMTDVTENIKNVNTITSVVSDANSICLWVMSGSNDLYYISGNRNTQNSEVAWNAPILFDQNVLQVAPFQKFKGGSSEVFLVHQDMSVVHHWQDQQSTNWLSKIERLDDSGFVLNFNSYTSHIHFEVDNQPLTNSQINITSSEQQYYVINGLMYLIDNDVPAAVQPDFQGNLTIISNSTGISPAILHLQGSLFEETLNVYPNGKIQHHLQNVKDGTSLTSAITQDGQPVLRPGTSSDVANAMASSISHINSMTATQFPPSLCGNTFLAVEKPPLNSSAIANLKHTFNSPLALFGLHPGTVIGTPSADKALTQQTPSTATAHTVNPPKKSSGIKHLGHDLGHVAGNLWHHVKKAVSPIISKVEDGVVHLADGSSFFIKMADEGLTFVIKIADETVTLVLSTVGSVFKALDWILHVVGADLDKMLAWLGHLIGWDHIFATQKMISGAVKGMLDFGVAHGSEYIGKLRAIVKDAFTTINKDVRATTLPTPINGGPLSISTISSTASSPSTSPNTPQTNLGAYYASNVKSKQGTSLPENVGSSTADAFRKFYSDVIKPAFELIRKDLGTDAEAFTNLLKHISMEKLKLLLADIADSLISVFATIVDGFLSIIESLMGDIQKVMEMNIEIPFLRSLWNFICKLFGGKEDFTLINAISLLVAIPSTISCKLATGKTPDEFNHGFDDPEFAASVAAKMKSSSSPKAPEDGLPSGKDFLRAESVRGTGQSGENNDATADDDAKWKQFSEAARFIPGVGSILTDVIDAWGYITGNDFAVVLVFAIQFVKSFFTWPIPLPDHTDVSRNMRWIVWSMALAMNFSILLSPCVDQDSISLFKFVGNLSNTITVLFINNEEHNPPLSWVADIVSNLGGTGSSLADIDLTRSPNSQVLKYCSLGMCMSGSILGMSAGGQSNNVGGSV